MLTPQKIIMYLLYLMTFAYNMTISQTEASHKYWQATINISLQDLAEMF